MRWKGGLTIVDLHKTRERNVFAWLPLYSRKTNTYYWLEKVTIIEQVEKNYAIFLLFRYTWEIIEVKPIES